MSRTAKIRTVYEPPYIPKWVEASLIRHDGYRSGYVDIGSALGAAEGFRAFTADRTLKGTVRQWGYAHTLMQRLRGEPLRYGVQSLKGPHRPPDPDLYPLLDLEVVDEELGPMMLRAILIGQGEHLDPPPDLEVWDQDLRYKDPYIDIEIKGVFPSTYKEFDASDS